MKASPEVFAIAAAALLGVSASAQSENATGTWTVSLTTPMGVESHVLELAQDGSARFDDAEVTVAVDGSAIAFSAPQETPIGLITFTYSGAIAGDEMSGDAEITGLPEGGPPGGGPGGPPPGGPGGPPPGGPGGPGGGPPSFEWTATRAAQE